MVFLTLCCPMIRSPREIPAGYAKVGVDEVVPMFSDMLLDMPGPNDE